MDYEVRRYINGTEYIASRATAFINILVADDDGDGDGDGDDESSDDNDESGANKSDNGADANAALPNTGASEHLNLIGGTGIALTLAGLTIVAAATRRRGGAHLA